MSGSAAPRFVVAPPQWSAEEYPTLPGSPAKLKHSVRRRVAYCLVAILVGLTGGLGNGLVVANLQAIQGQLGLTTVEAAWLPAVYYMFNMTANLLVFKFRQQFGLRLFAELGLGIYAALAVLHVFVHTFEISLLVRAASGLTAAAATSLGSLYMIQVLPRQKVFSAFIVGMSLSSMAVPLAWVLSPWLVDVSPWPSLYAFEAGLALCCLAAVMLFKLPVGMQVHVFERLDFVTFLLVAPAIALLCAVLVQGVNVWWFDTPWLAWALAGSLLLFALAAVVEWSRQTPLIRLRWLLHPSTLGFALGALVMRFMVSEQSYGAVGLLRMLGMQSDQLQPLYGVILVGMVLGTTLSALLFTRERVLWMILISIALISVGGWIDWNSTSLVRPHDFFFSQFLMSVAAALFIGPILISGMVQAISKGYDHIITFVVLFSVTQSLGGVLGPALLGTYQAQRTELYLQAIAAEMPASSAQVAQRLQSQQQAYARVLTDPALQKQAGNAQLAQIVKREAGVRAYNDVFLLIGLMTFSFLGYAVLRQAWLYYQAKVHPIITRTFVYKKIPT
ncbi:MAG: hypothetical protein WBI41_11620 [Azovibrio sp.]|uniref:hypothetical protein n=1 Tax=Azovibrio sp. TaxID=1872673 RepID=UPI003C7755C8